MRQMNADVLVVGAGGAGMYAAIEAARCGARVLLLDRSLIGRGGATVMAQMTVAAAVGPEGTDHWRIIWPTRWRRDAGGVIPAWHDYCARTASR
jgi:succinate dehydrogenase/fumarate reductase flavoprotein subunit